MQINTSAPVDKDMLRRLAFNLIPVFLQVLLAYVTFAADFSGSVVSVIDGDTIEALHNN